MTAPSERSLLDEKWMRRCLTLAAHGAGTVSPNPLVGSVVLDRRGRRVGEGFHQRAGGPHAEIVALAAAGSKAKGGTLYVSLEPCNHTGRTGPCTAAIAKAGIARVVFGVRDPIRAHGGGGKTLGAAGVEVLGGVLASECQRVNRIFFTHARKGRPHVVVKAATTLDGKSATKTGESKWITGSEARRHGRVLRGELDAICVGVGTVLADDPKLTARVRGVRDPIRVILDSSLRTPPAAQLLPANTRSSSRCIIVAAAAASAKRERALSAAGAEVWRVGDERVDVGEALARLGSESITSMLVEGGPTVAGSFMAGGFVDELRLYLAGRVFGGELGSWLGGDGWSELAAAPRFDIIEVERVGADVAITALVKARS